MPVGRAFRLRPAGLTHLRARRVDAGTDPWRQAVDHSANGQTRGFLADGVMPTLRGFCERDGARRTSCSECGAKLAACARDAGLKTASKPPARAPKPRCPSNAPAAKAEVDRGRSARSSGSAPAVRAAARPGDERSCIWIRHLAASSVGRPVTRRVPGLVADRPSAAKLSASSAMLPGSETETGA